jgi:hypothetical protein
VILPTTGPLPGVAPGHSRFGAPRAGGPRRRFALPRAPVRGVRSAAVPRGTPAH